MQTERNETASIPELIEEIKEHVRRQDIIIENLKEENSRQWNIGYAEGFKEGMHYKETFWKFLCKRLGRG